MSFILISSILLIAVLVYLNWNVGDLKYPLMLIGVTIYVATVSFSYYGSRNSMGQDTMVLNGYVVSKAQERTSCSHSYSCNCRTVTTGKTTTTQCDTCYEHPYDYDWAVTSTVGKTYIGRVDRRGSSEPKRWTEAYVGEPFSIEQSYFNYIRASPMSVFKDYNAYKDMKIPNYPKVFDYYRVKHTVDWHSQYKSGIRKVDELLTHKLKSSSAKAKANVVVIFYGGSDDIIEATKVKQFGGRINDLTVMIRANKDGQIQKVGVFSWSKNDMVNVLLRDEILKLGTLTEENNQKLVDILDTTLLKYYSHRSNDEFKYLEENIQTPAWVFILSFIMFLAVIGVNYFLLKSEVN